MTGCVAYAHTRTAPALFSAAAAEQSVLPAIARARVVRGTSVQNVADRHACGKACNVGVFMGT